MAKKVKSILSFLIPRVIKNQIKISLFRYNSFLIKNRQKKELKRLKCKVKNNEKIKVLFLVIHHSVWKLDEVFQKMMNDDLFQPQILICPYTIYGEEQMHDDMNSAFDFFLNKKYPVEKTLNDDGTWIKLNTMDDIVFFTNPYPLTMTEYYHNPLRNKLSCYVPYYFMATNHAGEAKDIYSTFFLSNVWKVFWPHNYHFNMHKMFSQNKAKNALISGYPSCEPLVLKKNNTQGIWKKQSQVKKKVIIAPHHTIAHSDDYTLSSFLELADFFQELALKYQDKVQWSFKPHPILRPNLNKHPKWGVKKTDEYYGFWKKNDFTQLDEGAYIDLFNQSDAIMHDSSSFICEYAFTGKPALFLMKKEKAKMMVNEFGKMFLSNYQIGKSKTLIESFVNAIIAGEKYIVDSTETKGYIAEYYGNKMPSDLIFNTIKKELIS